jgi:hypothetical protein
MSGGRIAELERRAADLRLGTGIRGVEAGQYFDQR